MDVFFVSHFSIKKVAAAASCLKEVFQKPAITTLVKAYEQQKIDHLFGYLEPFKSTKRTKVSYWENRSLHSQNVKIQNIA